MKAQPTVEYDGNLTAAEILGTALRQRLPQDLHDHIPSLTDRISCSVHVGEHLNTVFRDMSDAEQREFWREVQGTIEVFLREHRPPPDSISPRLH